MKFDIVIMNPPFHRHSRHFSIIKRMKLLSNKIIFIIPSKEGNYNNEDKKKIFNRV